MAEVLNIQTLIQRVKVGDKQASEILVGRVEKITHLVDFTRWTMKETDYDEAFVLTWLLTAIENICALGTTTKDGIVSGPLKILE